MGGERDGTGWEGKGWDGKGGEGREEGGENERREGRGEKGGFPKSPPLKNSRSATANGRVLTNELTKERTTRTNQQTRRIAIPPGGCDNKAAVGIDSSRNSNASLRCRDLDKLK